MYVAYRGAMVVPHFMCYCDVGHSSRQLYKGTIADWQTMTQEIDHFMKQNFAISVAMQCSP